MNSRTVCFCQPICSMISASVAPCLRWSITTTWAVLRQRTYLWASLRPWAPSWHRWPWSSRELLWRHVGRPCANRGYWFGGFAQFRTGLGCRNFSQCCITLDRANSRLRGRCRSGQCCEALEGLPDALAGHLPVGKLGHRLYAGKAVPDLHQPLIVRAYQIGELYFGRETPAPVWRAAVREAWTVMWFSVSIVKCFVFG
jgi:hypothetical protein